MMELLKTLTEQDGLKTLAELQTELLKRLLELRTDSGRW